jgi:hypothetical protein
MAEWSGAAGERKRKAKRKIIELVGKNVKINVRKASDYTLSAIDTKGGLGIYPKTGQHVRLDPHPQALQASAERGRREGFFKAKEARWRSAAADRKASEFARRKVKKT